MPVVRRIKGRGVTGWVEVHGETMFTQTGDVSSWMRGFSRKVTRFTSEAAPTNKRPRWSHYGLPLKRTFTSSTKASPATLKVHSAVGSTAPHAYYVDQGTGIHGGNGPYEAKILPPWSRQSPSLYERTFRVPENNGGDNISWVPIDTITIKGQRGQWFFDKGMARAFGASRMLTVQAPGTLPGMQGFPEMLANFTGNTPPDAAFRAQLEEWREWRDRAWKAKRILGEGYVAERYRREFRDVKDTIRRLDRAELRAQDRRKASAARSKRWRLKQRSAKAAAAAARRRNAERQMLEKRRNSAADRAANIARVRRELLAAIAKERLDLLRQAQEKYKGARVDVSGRRRHDGGYAFHITLVKNGRSVDFWVQSDYQSAL